MQLTDQTAIDDLSTRLDQVKSMCRVYGVRLGDGCAMLSRLEMRLACHEPVFIADVHFVYNLYEALCHIQQHGWKVHG